ncbi:MAG: M1 family aminopeptidase [Myxococcota bacterium]
MRHALPILLLLTACNGKDDDDVDVPVPPGQVEGEVVDYVYGFDAWSGAATATVSLDVELGGDCAQLDYLAPEPQACRFDGQEGTCTIQGDVLTVCGPEGVPQGSTLVVEVDLVVPKETYLSTDLGYATTALGGESDHYLLSWFGGCARFGPCDVDPATFATYRFEVAHQAGEMLLCPGELDPGDTLSTCTFELDGGPTYSAFGFAVSSRLERVELGRAGDVDVVWYDHDGIRQSSEVDIDDIKDFMSFMEELAGPYPYGDELRFFSWDSYWAGFEHPGNIAMNQNLTPVPTIYRDNPLLHTTLHEITHMWAGNQTTLASDRDFAWKEATAEYLTFVWEDDNEMGERSLQYWKVVAGLATTFAAPEDPELGLFDFYSNAYGPGPMILFRQLEVMFGRQAVLEAMTGFLGNGASTASIDDVQAALEVATGEDLEAYMNTWLRGSGEPAWPTIGTRIEGDTLIVDQSTMDGEVWPCAFHIRIVDSVGTLDVPVRYELDGTSTSLTLALSRSPEAGATIEIDPFKEALVYADASKLWQPTAEELGFRGH